MTPSRMSRLLRMQFAVLMVAILAVAAPAQMSAPTPLSLPQITERAGYIFSGAVTGVTRMPAGSAGAVETVRITFRITDGIRGVRAGDSLTISEWAGMWASGDRYRVGQQLMLFLYPPGPLGLTSPVGGDTGRFAIDNQQRVQVAQEPAGTLAGDLDMPGPVPRGPARRVAVPYRRFAESVRRAMRVVRDP